MNEHFYEDDREQLMKDYSRLYLFGGGCLIALSVIILGLLIGGLLWIKSILF